MKIVLFIIFIFWLIKVSRDILFWAYLWQLKEYRFDRMRAHFELQSAQQIFRNKIFGAKIALLGSSLFFFADVWQFLFQIIASLAYAAWGTKTAYDLYKKRLKIPALTYKAVGISAASFLVIFFFALFAYMKFSPHFFLFTLILLDVLAPGVVSSLVGILKFPSDFMKRRILAQAK